MEFQCATTVSMQKAQEAEQRETRHHAQSERKEWRGRSPLTSSAEGMLGTGLSGEEVPVFHILAGQRGARESFTTYIKHLPCYTLFLMQWVIVYEHLC